MELFSKNIIAKRRSCLEAVLKNHLKSQDVLLVFCGEPIQKPGGLDQTYPFLPHPEYFWLTGQRRAAGILAFSLKDGFMDFVRPMSREEKLWEGGSFDYPGEDVSRFETWLENQKFQRVFCFGQVPKSFQNHEKAKLDTELQTLLQESINQVRRKKDEAEIALIEKVAQMASHGYQLIEKIIRPGISERQIQIEYEAEIFRHGAEKVPYETIVGSGTNAAILHAVPTSKIVQKGELVLIDAGADWCDYCVDITRVFSAERAFSTQQKEIYQLVLEAQKKSISLCRPGTDWAEVHMASAQVMAEGLKTLGLMKGDVDSILETGAISTFFPHGVGHMVGLKVRDVGPRAGSSPRSICGIRLRVDLKLEEDFVMTVEPGLYFVEAMISDSDHRRKYSSWINWHEVEKWRQVGGVRLEDDIWIRAEGPKNLTELVAK